MSHGIDGAGLDKITAVNDESDANGSELGVSITPRISSASAAPQQILFGADFAQVGQPGERLDIF